MASSSMRRRLPSLANDRGSVSLFTIGIVLAGLFFVMLIVDGSRIRAQRRLVSDVAQQAARTAAQEVDESSRLGGDLKLDSASAVAAAQAVIAASGASGTAVVDEHAITVDVVMSVDLVFLDVLGDRTVRASREIEATEDY